jgi:hypothetical protein
MMQLEILKIYDESIAPSKHCIHIADQKKVLKLFSEMRFMKRLDSFSMGDKLDLARLFKIKHFMPGQRIY